VAGLTDPEDVPGGLDRGDEPGLVLGIGDGDQDVDDRLGSEAGDRG
jgi:hypothetical protein